jgi:Tfp pilus assembly protein PilF
METPTTAGTNPLSRQREINVVILLAAVVIVIYYKTFHFGFIDLDDNQYVFDNPFIRNGLNFATIKWAFTSYYAANWHPITWLTHALDISLAGMNAGWAHGVNVALHLVNSILVFVVLSKLTGRFWESVIVAGLFAAHPAHVESVAWVAERKDVLSTMFWFLTMWAYVRYVQQPPKASPPPVDEKPKKGKKKELEPAGPPAWAAPWSSSAYILVLVFFALGIMSKPMLVTLPFVLLLCDLWPLGRWRTIPQLRDLVLEKAPMFLMVIFSCLITVVAQKAGGAVQTLQDVPFSTRLLNAVISYAKYLGMLFCPTRLTVMYPYPASFPLWQIFLSVVVVGGISYLCWQQRKRRTYLLMGWLWFVGTLVPVIGLVQVGSQPLADRYTYIPFVGLFIMLVWGLADLCRTFGIDVKLSYALLALALVVLGVVSFHQVKFWQDDETAYRHALAVTTRNFMISYNLCHLLMTRDRLDEAEPLCRDAIDIAPQYVESYNTLGIIQLKHGQLAEAEANFKETLRRSPRYALVYSNLANAQILEGKPAEAEASLQQAVQLSAGTVSPAIFSQVLGELIKAYAKQGNDEKVAENLQRLLRLQPGNEAARRQRSALLYKLKKTDEAQAEIEKVLQAHPNDAESLNLYGLILIDKGQKDDAIKQFQAALNTEPEFNEAKQNLARAQAMK